MVDCLNHMWLKSDPVLRKYKRVPATRPKKSDASTTSTKNPDDILLESFIIEWNGITEKSNAMLWNEMKENEYA